MEPTLPPKIVSTFARPGAFGGRGRQGWHAKGTAAEMFQVLRDEMVQCPVCRDIVAYQGINAHLDAHHAQEEEGAQPTTRPRMSAPSASRDEATVVSAAAPQLETPPSLSPESNAADPDDPARGDDASSVRTKGTTNPAGGQTQEHSAAGEGTVDVTGGEDGKAAAEQIPAPEQLPRALAEAKPQHAALAQALSHSVHAHYLALEAVLEAEMDRARLRVAAGVDTVCAQVEKLRSTTLEQIDTNAAEVAAYSSRPRPTTCQELRERNEMRNRLTSVATSTQGAAEYILEAPALASNWHRDEERCLLESIDSVMRSLAALRERTADRCRDLEGIAVKVYEASEAATASMGPEVEKLDGFVRCYAEEAGEETAAGTSLDAAKLAHLREEEMKHVRANDSPDKNPAFAQVQADILKTEESLQERREQQDKATNLLAQWDYLMGRLPTATEHSTGWLSGLLKRGLKRGRDSR